MFKKIFQISVLSWFLFFCLLSFSEAIQAYNDPLIDKTFENLLPEPEWSNFSEMLDWLIQRNLVYYTKWLMVSISIGALSYYGFMYIMTNTNESNSWEKHENLLWAIIGFALIGISNLALEIFKPERSEAIIDIDATNEGIMKVVVFVEYMFGAIAILYMLLGAIRFITADGDESVMENEKRNFTWGFLGLIIIMIADTFINVIYDKETKSFAWMTGLQKTSGELFGVINFLMGFVAVIAVLSIVIAGIYYVTSFGDDEAAGKAKKIIRTTLIGFLIISLAYVVVATFAR